jgi:uncharacterized RDD family membrane protein YckC
MTIPTDALNEEYTIDTPENVRIGYSVAGIGNRFIAALVDSVLVVGALFAITLLIVVLQAIFQTPEAILGLKEDDWRQGLLIAFYALATFMLIWGYYMLFEWLWNGQTPGKRLAKIRVVRLDGSPPRFLDIVVRNLVRIIDFMPFGYGVGLVTMFFNREARRLGDFAAGVIVVKDQGELRLDDVTGGLAPLPHPVSSGEPGDVAREQPLVGPLEQFPGLRRLTVADYELVQESLRRHNNGTLDALILTRLARVMAQKVQAHAPPDNWSDSRRWLGRLMDAYQSYHGGDKVRG